MFGYGKMSSSAIAAMSALAEVHAQGNTLSSLQIAESRNLPHPIVAKVLTILSQHALIHGTRGPGGGYRLAKEPSSISLLDVVILFEGHHSSSSCPFGPGWCGHGEPCPMHNDLLAINESAAERLRILHFGSFVNHPKPNEALPLA